LAVILWSGSVDGQPVPNRGDGVVLKLLEKIHSPADVKALERSDLPLLAEEIRTHIVNVVSHTGGHLASSLGVVELTIAIHYVFDIPNDKLIWDVGHQSYAHKIITGRKDRFHTLRKLNGLSGFTRISESDYDAFTTGHSSTSISAGLGIACAKQLKKDHRIKITSLFHPLVIHHGDIFFKYF